MGKEKGITLISLIVTIIIMALLATAGITGVVRSQKESKQSALESELKTVQHAVLERRARADLTQKEYEELPGKEISNEKVEQVAKGVTLKGEEGDYKVLEKSDLEKLGITEAEDTYIVNYKTCEVINQTNYKNFDEPLYVSYE